MLIAHASKKQLTVFDSKVQSYILGIDINFFYSIIFSASTLPEGITKEGLFSSQLPKDGVFQKGHKSLVLDFQGVFLLFVVTEHAISTHSRHRIQDLLSAQRNVIIRISSVQQKFKTRMSPVEHLYLLYHLTVGNRF